MANTENSVSLQKLQSIPDLTYEAKRHLPSLLLTSPDDSRIDKLAEKTPQLFLVRTEGIEKFIVIVNPNSSQGILWWKKKSRLILLLDRWLQINKSGSTLDSEEAEFFKKCGF